MIGSNLVFRERPYLLDSVEVEMTDLKIFA